MIQKLLIAFVLLAVLAVGLALGLWLSPEDYAPAAPQTDGQANLPYRAGPFRLDVSISPKTPVVGDNTLTIRLANQQGEPVAGARIQAVAEMPAMGAMPAMRAPADMQAVAPGLYRGHFEPAMEGAWPLTIRIEKAGIGRAQVSFDLATGRPGLRPAGGLGVPGATQTQESPPPGTIRVDARRRQLIGVTFGVAQRRPLTRTIRAYGSVAFDETRLSDINLKYKAWVGELYADYVGAQVDKGEVLFTVYSPDLYAAQREYLATYRNAGPGSDLLAAARQRLEFWDVSEDFVKKLRERGEPVKYVPVRSPVSGTVVTSKVVEGTAHPAGMTLMRIADLSEVWVEAAVYEADLPLIEPGIEATVTLPYLPGETFTGTVDYVYPYLNDETRTGRVRISLPNPAGYLRPEMYAEVKLKIPLGEALAVPREAVLVAGENRIVFEDLGNGRLAPRHVVTGRRSEGFVEILKGLEAGDRVVTSGNFLIAAESKLKAGLEQW